MKISSRVTKEDLKILLSVVSVPLGTSQSLGRNGSVRERWVLNRHVDYSRVGMGSVCPAEKLQSLGRVKREDLNHFIRSQHGKYGIATNNYKKAKQRRETLQVSRECWLETQCKLSLRRKICLIFSFFLNFFWSPPNNWARCWCLQNSPFCSL